MTAPDELPPDSEPDARLSDDAPPLLGSWNRVYALVLGVLLAQVIAYYALTRFYS